MKQESLSFSKMPVEQLVRLEDRISFLYLERMKIVQGEHGIKGYSKLEDEGQIVESIIQIPVGGIALLMLGPGTSITNAAAVSISRFGCTIMFTSGGGINLYSTMQPLTNSSKWALAQASIVTNSTASKKVAKQFYKKQFGHEIEGSIAQMRGMEGSLMRKMYSHYAKVYKIGNFRRDTKSEDNINSALNILNSILYGLAAVVCQALNLSPALGIIHRGDTNSLLFDIADFYKPSITIPLAFSLVGEEPQNLARAARLALRKEIETKNILKDMLETITESFSPYLPSTEGETLIGEVKAHTNYGSKG